MKGEVISSSNKVYDLGSMRESGTFIAEFLNEHFKMEYLNLLVCSFTWALQNCRGKITCNPYTNLFSKG